MEFIFADGHHCRQGNMVLDFMLFPCGSLRTAQHILSKFDAFHVCQYGTLYIRKCIGQLQVKQTFLFCDVILLFQKKGEGLVPLKRLIPLQMFAPVLS